MSQQTLADKVGVTRQTIFAIEKDKYSPSLEVAFKISNVFRTYLGMVLYTSMISLPTCYYLLYVYIVKHT